MINAAINHQLKSFKTEMERIKLTMSWLLSWIISILLLGLAGRMGERVGQADVAIWARIGQQAQEERRPESVDAAAQEGTRRPREEPHRPPRQEEGIAHPQTPRTRTVKHQKTPTKSYLTLLF